MKQFVILFSAVLLSFLYLFNDKEESTVPDEKLNIILIMTDDQGYGDFGFTGNPYIKTPNIDKLAASGTRFTDFYVSPVCAPTRASLMTGNLSYRVFENGVSFFA